MPYVLKNVRDVGNLKLKDIFDEKDLKTSSFEMNLAPQRWFFGLGSKKRVVFIAKMKPLAQRKGKSLKMHLFYPLGNPTWVHYDRRLANSDFLD